MVLKRIRLTLLITIAVISLFGFFSAGCNTSTPTSFFLTEQGTHPTDWVSKHPASAKPDGRDCIECHGDDLRGGISKVSCFSSSRNGISCHAAGPAFHPDTWTDKSGSGTANFHAYAFQNNLLQCDSCHDLTVKCQECHFGTGGQKVPSGSTWAHGAIPGHSAFSQNATQKQVCINCHDVNTSFGHAPSCHNCHAPFPNPHPTGWDDPANHGATAKSAPGATSGFSYCQQCHGNDFAGGTTNQSCFTCHGVSAPHSPKPWRGSQYTHTNTDTQNASVCADCHTNGDNSSRSPANPAPSGTAPGCFNSTLCHGNEGHSSNPNWSQGTEHGPVAKSDLTFCQTCHGESGGAGSNPLFNLPLGSLTNGCEDCHAAQTAHPINQSTRGWTNHPSAGNMANACALCHGANLTEGGNGPACTTCHAKGSPLVLTNCTSCHGKPPSGTVAFNRAKSHGPHDSLPKVTSVCDTCHNNAGTGTTVHFDANIDMNILSTYNAKTGSGSFNSSTDRCANISCHGGQTTPVWGSGSINVATDCTSCHELGTSAGNPQYNSPYSGKHDKHVNKESLLCSRCHEPTKLAADHFSHLDTSALEGPVSATFRSNLNYSPGNPPTCNPSAGGSTGCHGGEQWK